MTSGGPPAVDGTTSLIGRSGNACALSKTRRGAISISRAASSFCFMASPDEPARMRALPRLRGTLRQAHAASKFERPVRPRSRILRATPGLASRSRRNRRDTGPRARGVAKRRMRRDVLDPLAVAIDLAAITQAFKVLRARERPGRPNHLFRLLHMHFSLSVGGAVDDHAANIARARLVASSIIVEPFFEFR